MKKVKSRTVVLLLGITLLFSSCYGPFNLTHRLHEWNGSLGDKWINALVFYGLLVVPVYEVATAVDALVLNTIEFWTGDNPMSFRSSKKIEKLVQNENGTYKITTKWNSIVIEGMEGSDKGKVVKMRINEENKQLFLEKEGELIKLAEFDELAQTIRVYQPDGSSTEINPALSTPLAYIQEHQN